MHRASFLLARPAASLLTLSLVLALCSRGLSAELRSVSPTLAAPADILNRGGTILTVSGLDLASDMLVSISSGRVERALLDQTFEVRTGRITGRVPNVAAGIYDAKLLSAAGRTLYILESAVEVAPPAAVNSVSPLRVSRFGGTPVTILGANFKNVTEVTFGSHIVAIASVSKTGTEMRGTAPPLASTEPDGPYTVVVRDSRGTDRLIDGVIYETTFRLDDVSPRLVSTLGGTRVTFSGEGFLAGMLLSIGGKALTDVVVVSERQATGKTPTLAAGFHDALITRGAAGGPQSRKIGIVEASPPPTLTSVTPSEIPIAGGITVTFAGTGFRAGVTQFLLDGLPILNPELVPVAAGSVARGIAPAHPAGPVVATVMDSRGTDALGNAVTYVKPDRTAPLAPFITETGLAHDQARFEWENPVAYDAIEVLDEGDNVIATLPGNAQMYQTSARGSKSLVRKVRGISRVDGISAAVPGYAVIHQCEVPPPLLGVAEPGELEFPLFGNHFATNDNACASGGEGGGGAVAQFDHPLNGLQHLQSGGSGGSGYVVTGSAGLDIDKNVFKFLDRKKLTTGFTLEQDSDKIQVQVFYEKIAVAADLELRGRLIHVFPDDGFRAEFSFPETLIKGQKEWHSTIFFRSSVDSGTGEVLPCKDDQGELLKIPAGEYLLDLYAVNGEGKLPYFLVADDPLDIELLIKGSPCPPYPMTRVTDLSGLRTVPTVKCLKPEIVATASGTGDKTLILAKIHAQGIWTDFDNSIYRIHPDGDLCLLDKGIKFTDPWKNSVDFEYSWNVFGDKEFPSISKLTGNSPILPVLLPDYGCYKVELTVRDKRCGLESKYAQEVALFPDSISCNASHVASSTCTNPQQSMQAAYFFPQA